VDLVRYVNSHVILKGSSRTVRVNLGGLVMVPFAERHGAVI